MLKSFLFICLGITLAANICAQDINGSWYGVFRNPQGQPQRLQMIFQKQDAGWKGQMKSPDVTYDSIAMDAIVAKGDTLRFTVNKIKVTYTGIWNILHNRYNGYFEQLGNRIPLNISRKEIQEDSIQDDLQGPGTAIAYDQQEVKFVDKTDKVLLTGTLSKPGVSRRFPAIVLISGAGRNSRDQEVLGHPVFELIADYLTKHGMAVLRFDDRGAGGSTGRYDSANIYNFANDATAAVQYLRQRPDIDTSFIGLLGYHEGGVIGQIVAARDKHIAFLVQMATQGLTGLTERLISAEGGAAAAGHSPDTVKLLSANYKQYMEMLATEKDTVSRRKQAYVLLERLYKQMVPDLNGPGLTEYITDAYESDIQPETLSLLTYDPAVYLAKVTCPVLAINGEMDIENNSPTNLTAISHALVAGGNNQVTIRSFPGLNHLFQHCNTCTIDEYGTLSETINPTVLEFITRWVQLLY